MDGPNRSSSRGVFSRGPADRCRCQVAPTPAVHHHGAAVQKQSGAGTAAATHQGDAPDVTAGPSDLHIHLGTPLGARPLRLLRARHQRARASA